MRSYLICSLLFVLFFTGKLSEFYLGHNNSVKHAIPFTDQEKEQFPINLYSYNLFFINDDNHAALASPLAHKKTILINKNAWSTLDQKQKLFILYHEKAHIDLKHAYWSLLPYLMFFLLLTMFYTSDFFGLKASLVKKIKIITIPFWIFLFILSSFCQMALDRQQELIADRTSQKSLNLSNKESYQIMLRTLNNSPDLTWFQELIKTHPSKKDRLINIFPEKETEIEELFILGRKLYNKINELSFATAHDKTKIDKLKKESDELSNKIDNLKAEILKD